MEMNDVIELERTVPIFPTILPLHVKVIGNRIKVTPVKTAYKYEFIDEAVQGNARKKIYVAKAVDEIIATQKETKTKVEGVPIEFKGNSLKVNGREYTIEYYNVFQIMNKYPAIYKVLKDFYGFMAPEEKWFALVFHRKEPIMDVEIYAESYVMP
ncbi:hypothetical protein [Pyrococcus kukulkanii]|uniref:Uncharacterized protein n=1 Tax=Pyrococcus kukulkanii TaxID=1609559 RepID=A0ABV4T7Y8_9EURY